MYFPDNRMQPLYAIENAIRSEIVENNISRADLRRAKGEQYILSILIELTRGTNAADTVQRSLNYLGIDIPLEEVNPQRSLS